MSDFRAGAWTAVFGIAVFVAGQGVQRFLLEPVQEQRKTLGEVAFALLMFGNVGHVADLRASGHATVDVADPIEVVRTLRSLASRLQQSLYVIPAYRFLAFLHVVPKKSELLLAISSLTGWSNSIFHGQPGVHRDRIATVLQIVRPD